MLYKLLLEVTQDHGGYCLIWKILLYVPPIPSACLFLGEKKRGATDWGMVNICSYHFISSNYYSDPSFVFSWRFIWYLMNSFLLGSSKKQAKRFANSFPPPPPLSSLSLSLSFLFWRQPQTCRDGNIWHNTLFFESVFSVNESILSWHA